MSIGQNIKKLRTERSLTQEQVAESLDVSFQAVSSWERDEYKPDTDKLIRLSEILDVSVSFSSQSVWKVAFFHGPVHPKKQGP